MEPVPDELGLVGALGLCDLVFMVGEDEVAAAAVDVYRLAEVFGRHRAAFDMPAGTAWTPGAIPCRFSGLRGLPEREVERLLFAFVDVDARPGEQLVDALLGEFAVLIEARDVEVDVAVDLISMPLFDERLDDLYDRRDLVRGARVDRRAADAEGVGVLVVFGSVPRVRRP